MNNEAFESLLNDTLAGNKTTIPQAEAWAFYKATMPAWQGKGIDNDLRWEAVARQYDPDGSLENVFNNITHTQEFRESLVTGLKNSPAAYDETGYWEAVSYIPDFYPGAEGSPSSVDKDYDKAVNRAEKRIFGKNPIQVIFNKVSNFFSEKTAGIFGKIFKR